MAWELERRIGARASTASGGWRSSAMAAGWFQWGLGEEKGAASCARSRQSSLGGQRGRRSCGEAGRRRAWARRCSAERRRCSGASEWGASERAGGMECWGTCNARARARRERRALQRARHRDGEVVAAGLGGGAWQSGESTSARQRAVEKVGSDAWVPARSRRWPGWPSTARSVLNSGGGRRSKQASWRKGKRDLDAISKNSRDPIVNQR